MKAIRAIIPAAGKGSRLQSISGEMPKAMFEVGKRPMLEYVLENVSFVDEKETYIVVGYGKDKIIGHFGDRYAYVEQKQQLGTGHAVMECAEAFATFDGSVQGVVVHARRYASSPTTLKRTIAERSFTDL